MEVVVTFGLHWLRLSTDVEDVEEVVASIEGVSGGEFGEGERRGLFNHPWRRVHDSGAKVFYGGSQPIVVEVPGEACERVGTEAAVTWASNLAGRPTRVDLAADVEPAGLSRRRVKEMRRVFRRGDCDTRIPRTSAEWMQDDRPGGGCTLYVGSRASEWFLRAYDRRGPLRLECQWKPDRSVRDAVPGALERYGAAGVWRELAQRCVWPMKWYRDVLEGECSDVTRVEPRVSDLGKLMEAIRGQFGPALAGLRAGGVLIEDLEVPIEEWSSDQKRKWRSLVPQLEAAGYDPSVLREKVKRCRE